MSKNAAGFTLPELLLVSTVTIAITNVLALQFTSTARLHRLTELALDRNHGIREIEDRFRDEIRTASEVLPAIGPFESDSDTLVLASRNGGYVVLGSSLESRGFSVVYLDKDILTVARRATFALNCEPAFELGKDDSGRVQLVTLRLNVDVSGTPRTTSSTNTVMAALGGGAR